MKYPKDITGMRFGRLTAVKKVGTKGSGRGSKAIWLCRCDCGNEKEILRNSLVSGTTKSCGCLEKEIKSTMHLKHGMAKSRLWNIWTGMRDRCSRSNNKDYQRYGGRGIRVCPEWDSDFRNFYDWSMGNGYSDELTIDRIDNDGNYEPSNCRWVTRKEQTRNRSITKTIPLARIAEIDGITYQAAYDKYVRCNVSNLSGAKSRKECDGMCGMEWKEADPEQDDWEKQIDIVAYYGSITVGSIVYCGKEIGWQSVIDGHMDFMQAESLEDAKKEMIDILDEHFTDQINYYHDLQDSLEKLNAAEVN